LNKLLASMDADSSTVGISADEAASAQATTQADELRNR
jgi:hypothetical protein